MRTAKANTTGSDPPVWCKRVWTGNATVEVAIFKYLVTEGPDVAAFSISAKRVWMVGEQEKGSRSFHPEDLLPLARLLGEAFDFVSAQ